MSLDLDRLNALFKAHSKPILEQIERETAASREVWVDELILRPKIREYLGLYADQLFRG